MGNYVVGFMRDSPSVLSHEDKLMAQGLTTGCYLVACPALNEREVCYGIQHANDVCYSMHMDSGGAYAYVEDWLGWTDIEYGEL